MVVVVDEAVEDPEEEIEAERKYNRLYPMGASIQSLLVPLITHRSQGRFPLHFRLLWAHKMQLRVVSCP